MPLKPSEVSPAATKDFRNLVIDIVLDLFLQEPAARETIVQYDRHRETITGPPSTNQEPHHEGTGFSDDTGDDTRHATAESNPGDLLLGRWAGCVATEESLTRLPTSQTQSIRIIESLRNQEYRRELFKLLIAHINGINQFRTDAYKLEAEERLNILLHQFLINDTDTLQKVLGDHFTRLHIAVESWMNMRHQLSEFRTMTGYFGEPGEHWEHHLRHMPNVPCAHACIAYADLQDSVAKESRLGCVEETFDDDLARMFDLFTMIKGCNGAEAFKALRTYNAALLEWFK